MNKRKPTLKGIVPSLMPAMKFRVQQEKFFNAVAIKNIPEITKAINSGVNPNFISSDYGTSALHILAERHDYILIFYLLKEGKNVDVNIKSNHGFTPLHFACLCNSINVVELLLEHGADIEITDRLEKTSLHLAVERQLYAIVYKLLKHNAQVNVLDCFKNTPLSISIVIVQNIKIANILFRYGADFSLEVQRPMHIFFETILYCKSIEAIDFVFLLIDRGVDINLTHRLTQQNCLHFVAITDNLELAVMLVENGADRFAVDITDRTPAKVALDHGHKLLADYLKKGYRPPALIKTLPLMFLWIHKLRNRIKAAQEMENLEANTS